MKKKVLIFHSGLAPYRLRFFEELSCRIPIHLFFYFKSIIAHQTDADELSVDPQSSMEWCIRRRQVKWRPVFTLVRIVPRMIRAFYVFRPSTVLVTEYSPISVVAAVAGRLFGSKVVLWTDDSVDNAENSSQIRKIQRAVLFRLAQRLIVINPDVARYYRKIFKGDTFTSLLLQPEAPVRERLFSEKTTAYAEKLLRQHSLAQAKVILFVGRLSPEKNLPFLLEGFAHTTAASDEDVRLVMVGSGPDESELKAMVNKLEIKEKVIFAGYQPRDEHLWAWYRLAGLFVLPSVRERFGAVVNEALICGVPVLCSKYAGASCLIESPSMGEMFNPTKRELFEDQLVNSLKNSSPASRYLVENRPSLMTHGFSEAVAWFVEACQPTP